MAIMACSCYDCLSLSSYGNYGMFLYYGCLPLCSYGYYAMFLLWQFFKLIWFFTCLSLSRFKGMIWQNNCILHVPVIAK